MRDISWKLENPHKITEAELTALEERFGFRMPEDMRQFYLQHNGGILPSGAKIDPERCKLTDFLAIKYPLMERIPSMDTLLEWQKMDGFIPMYYIPFCNDEAGDSYYAAPSEKYNDTDQKNIGYDFSYGLLQLFAVKKSLPQCLSSLEHPYVQLLLGNFEKAVKLLSSTLVEYDAIQPYAVLMSEAQRLTIQAMAEKDEKRLTDQLIQRVKAYRKQPVGYSTFVDAYSIAYIKLARLNNMSCDLDIVEIPKMFFDDAVCQIDTQKVKLPFFDDAIEQLKKIGVNWC